MRWIGWRTPTPPKSSEILDGATSALLQRQSEARDRLGKLGSIEGLLEMIAGASRRPDPRLSTRCEAN